MKTTKKNHKYSPNGWQLNWTNLNAPKIQYWMDGVMITRFSPEEARNMVIDRKAFVISEQAIGALDNNGYSIA